MKKIILSIAALAMVFGAILMSSCTKDDTVPPVISLLGNETDVVVYKSSTTYNDLGATATDDKDGTVTPVVTGTVDMNSAGEYKLTYTATDAAGNSATKTRTVIVDAAPYLAGLWSHTDVVDGTTYDPENETISVSPSTKNKIYFSKFAGYTNAQPYATLSGSSMTMPSQAFTCGTDQVSRTFAGTASASFTNLGWTINFTITQNIGGTPVTVNGSSVYVPAK